MIFLQVNVNVWTKFHGNPSNNCQDVSLWIPNLASGQGTIFSVARPLGTKNLTNCSKFMKISLVLRYFKLDQHVRILSGLMDSHRAYWWDTVKVKSCVCSFFLLTEANFQENTHTAAIVQWWWRPLYMSQPRHPAVTTLLIQSPSRFGQTGVQSALWLTGWRGVERMTRRWWNRCASVSSCTWRDVASARPHDSDPLSLARSWKSVFLKDRKSAGGMSYRTLGGRAVHFQIISEPPEKYMKREKLSRISMHCMNIVYSSIWNWIIFWGIVVYFIFYSRGKE